MRIRTVQLISEVASDSQRWEMMLACVSVLQQPELIGGNAQMIHDAAEAVRILSKAANAQDENRASLASPARTRLFQPVSNYWWVVIVGCSGYVFWQLLSWP